MKNRFRMILFSSIALVLVCLFLCWSKEQTAAPTPEPSVMGGYYKDAFYLSLNAPKNGTIYYTTDGRTPTTDSLIYQDPILIANRTNEPNLYRSYQTVVKDWKNYVPDTTPVEKATVIRAVYVNKLGIASEVMTQTYFVGIAKPEMGYTLSLIFEPDSLFGEDGIYVTGTEYDDWYLSENKDSPEPIPNFEKDLEIPAVAVFITDSGDVLNQQIGLKLQGNTARGEIRKRFTLVSRETYSGSHTFDIPIFPNVATHSVMLKYYFPDAIAADLLSDRSVSVQQCVPVRVFLNGEFLYDSFMLERYDSTYFNQHYQINQYQLIKNGAVDSDSTINADLPVYEEFMYWVDNTDFSDSDQWEQLLKEIDVQSYIDWITANYFFCNIDFWDDHNYVTWRSSYSGSNDWEDTRWRWCVYDIDALEWIGNDPSRGEEETINIFSNHMDKDMYHTTLFPALRRNPEFCRQFVLSFMDMLNNNFSPDNVEKVLKKYGETIEWKDGYFRRRPAYAVQHLADEFNLTGTLETVTIQTSDPAMGTVTVNTSVIDLSPGSWMGQYFTDYPITVTAAANEGYEFLGWKGDIETADASVTLSVEGGLSLEAVFVKTE